MADKKKKYWYLFTVFECPVCGSWETIKERQYTPKPEDPAKRHEFVQQFDGCERYL